MEFTQLLSKWSEVVLTHSTVIGRVWLTILFFFRVSMLMVQASILPQNTLTTMVCDTAQPGCEESCHNYFYPVLPARFWCVQIVFVSTPTVLYLAYVMHAIYDEGKDQVKMRKCVKLCYFAQLLVKIILEVAFIAAQFVLYSTVLHYDMTCRISPCPGSVNCYVAHSNELTVIFIYMLIVACVCMFFNMLEGLLLLRKLKRQGKDSSLESTHLMYVSNKWLKNLSSGAEACDLKQADEGMQQERRNERMQ